MEEDTCLVVMSLQVQYSERQQDYGEFNPLNSSWCFEKAAHGRLDSWGMQMLKAFSALTAMHGLGEHLSQCCI